MIYIPYNQKGVIYGYIIYKTKAIKTSKIKAKTKANAKASN